jgi:ABC-2 type transport system permease protein
LNSQSSFPGRPPHGPQSKRRPIKTPVDLVIKQDDRSRIDKKAPPPKGREATSLPKATGIFNLNQLPAGRTQMILASTYKNWIVTKRNFFTVLEIIFWPATWLFSIGLLGAFLDLPPEEVAFLLIGSLALSALQLCQLDVTYAILYDVWSKSVKQTQTSPVRPYQLFLGSWFLGVVRGLGVLLILAMFALYAFDFNFLEAGAVPLFWFMTGIFLNALALGIVVCVLLVIVGHKAEVVTYYISTLLMMLCGIYYPIDVLPQPFYAMAKAIPVTYFLDYYRGFYGFETLLESPLLIGLLMTFLYIALAMLLFAYSLRKARRNGAILRLSE